MSTKNYRLTKVNPSKYFYMLMLFLWCAYTAPFLKPFDSEYLFSSFLYIIIYGVYFSRNCFKRNNRPLVIVLGLMAFWYAGQCVKSGGLTKIDFRLLYSMVLAHVAFYLYKGKGFFLYFEKVLMHMTILSLIVWSLGMLAPGFIKAVFNVISVWTNGGTTYGNFFFVALGGQHSMGLLRNIGFTWEAGRFSCFLVVGLFFSLILHNMRIKGNRSFWVFLAGILSTVSTTGIGSCLGVALLYLYNRDRSNRILWIAVSCILLPVIWSLDFISGKIIANADVEQEIRNMAYMFGHGSEAICPQRITGLFLELQNWIHDFWFGYNLNEQSYTQAVLFGGYEVWLSNGLIQIFSKYGTFVGIFLYYCMFKSSGKMISDFGYKGSLIYAFTFMLISISYDFWASGIFLYFTLYWLYCKFVPQCYINYENHKKMQE